MTAVPKGVVPPRFRRISTFLSFGFHRRESFRQTKLISTSVTLPPNLKFLSRSVSTEGSRSATLSPRFRRTSFFVPFRVHCRIIAFHQTRFPLPLRFRQISFFSPFRVHGRIAFRQLHIPLLLRFGASLDFVPFRVHGSTYFRDDYTRVQTNKKYHLYTFCVF